MLREPEEKPKIYILAGPNGAGKTTFADKFLPEFAGCKEFLNADLIAAGLSPYSPDSQAIWASKLLLERMNRLVEERQTFSFETTLAGKSYRPAIRRWRELGFEVHLLFLWLPSADMACERVLSRVRQGGHTIPENVICRRFSRGVANLFRIYLPCVDNAKDYDSSQVTPQKIWERIEGVDSVIATNLWKTVQHMEKDST